MFIFNLDPWPTGSTRRCMAYCGVLILACIALPRYAFANTVFPEEFVSYAKTLKCEPLRDKPYYWGAIKGSAEKDSAVFWCKSKEDSAQTKVASIAIYVREGAKKSISCPRLIPEQTVGTILEVWEPGVGEKKPHPLSEMSYLDNKKPGPKGQMASGYIIENMMSRGTAGTMFYCHNGRWLWQSYC